LKLIARQNSWEDGSCHLLANGAKPEVILRNL
jgi:hypothetical protein